MGKIPSLLSHDQCDKIIKLFYGDGCQSYVLTQKLYKERETTIVSIYCIRKIIRSFENGELYITISSNDSSEGVPGKKKKMSSHDRRNCDQNEQSFPSELTETDFDTQDSMNLSEGIVEDELDYLNKLAQISVVYTKRLEDMSIFRAGFRGLTRRELIEHVEQESIPKLSKLPIQPKLINKRKPKLFNRLLRKLDYLTNIDRNHRIPHVLEDTNILQKHIIEIDEDDQDCKSSSSDEDLTASELLKYELDHLTNVDHNSRITDGLEHTEVLRDHIIDEEEQDCRSTSSNENLAVSKLLRYETEDIIKTDNERCLSDNEDFCDLNKLEEPRPQSNENLINKLCFKEMGNYTELLKLCKPVKVVLHDIKTNMDCNTMKFLGTVDLTCEDESFEPLSITRTFTGLHEKPLLETNDSTSKDIVLASNAWLQGHESWNVRNKVVLFCDNDYEMYFIDNSGFITEYYRFDHRPDDHIVDSHCGKLIRVELQCCCWQRRNEYIKNMTPSILNNIQFLFKPHKCSSNRCLCCCKFLDKSLLKHTVDPATEVSLFRGKLVTTENSRVHQVKDRVQNNLKHSAYSSKISTKNILLEFDSTWFQELPSNLNPESFINKCLNFNKNLVKSTKLRSESKVSFGNQTSTTKQKVIKIVKTAQENAFEIYETGSRGELLFHAICDKTIKNHKPVSNLFNYLKGSLTESYCCWVKRYLLQKQHGGPLLPLPKHSCLPGPCNCCCNIKPTAQEMPNLSTIELPVREKHQWNYNDLKTRCNISSKNTTNKTNSILKNLLSKSSFYDSLKRKSQPSLTLSDKTHLAAESTGERNPEINALPKSNRAVPSSLPNIKHNVSLNQYASTTPPAIYSNKRKLEVTNGMRPVTLNCKSTFSISNSKQDDEDKFIPNIKIPEHLNSPAVIATQNPIINIKLSSVLEKFKNTRLTVNKHGLVSAALGTSLNNLTNTELDVLKIILSHAQEQVERMGLKPGTEFTARATPLDPTIASRSLSILLENITHVNTSKKKKREEPLAAEATVLKSLSAACSLKHNYYTSSFLSLQKRFLQTQTKKKQKCIPKIQSVFSLNDLKNDALETTNHTNKIEGKNVVVIVDQETDLFIKKETTQVQKSSKTGIKRKVNKNSQEQESSSNSSNEKKLVVGNMQIQKERNPEHKVHTSSKLNTIGSLLNCTNNVNVTEPKQPTVITPSFLTPKQWCVVVQQQHENATIFPISLKPPYLTLTPQIVPDSSVHVNGINYPMPFIPNILQQPGLVTQGIVSDSSVHVKGINQSMPFLPNILQQPGSVTQGIVPEYESINTLHFPGVHQSETVLPQSFAQSSPHNEIITSNTAMPTIKEELSENVYEIYSHVSKKPFNTSMRTSNEKFTEAMYGNNSNGSKKPSFITMSTSNEDLPEAVYETYSHVSKQKPTSQELLQLNSGLSNGGVQMPFFLNELKSIKTEIEKDDLILDS